MQLRKKTIQSVTDLLFVRLSASSCVHLSCVFVSISVLVFLTLDPHRTGPIYWHFRSLLTTPVFVFISIGHPQGSLCFFFQRTTRSSPSSSLLRIAFTVLPITNVRYTLSFHNQSSRCIGRNWNWHRCGPPHVRMLIFFHLLYRSTPCINPVLLSHRTRMADYQHSRSRCHADLERPSTTRVAFPSWDKRLSTKAPSSLLACAGPFATHMTTLALRSSSDDTFPRRACWIQWIQWNELDRQLLLSASNFGSSPIQL